jgi:predicted nucleic-acid-binding protein
MLAVDTNVLVRFFTREDPMQAEAALNLLERNPVWVAKTVLLETEWVLQSVYDFSPERTVQALRDLVGMDNVELEEPLQVAQALDWCEFGLEFADALHLASRKQGSRFATFDDKLVRRAKRAGVPDVVLPV